MAEARSVVDVIADAVVERLQELYQAHVAEDVAARAARDVRSEP